jgi:5-(aminomethyl)-3-furanmethanol phosphate kinase
MQKTQVVKIGGSLLGVDDLKFRLQRWRDLQPGCRQVFLVGGGALVEQIRIFEQRFGLAESVSHELSCELMGITARLAIALLPNVPIMSDVTFICKSDQSVIFDSSRWLLNERPTEASWDATSDSIAAALAKQIGAQQLVLMKSLDVPPGKTVVEASTNRWVDLCFPKYAHGIEKITIVNMRSGAMTPVDLK